jgi:hypothetical protein
MKIIRNTIIIFLTGMGFWACDPYMEGDIDLGPLPEAPAFSVEILPDDSNRVVIKDLSEGFFSRFWSLPGGMPNQSVLAVDTILYRKAGVYTITLYTAKAGGSGTSSAIRQVIIEKDAEVPCSDEITLLAGGCEAADSKCWTFSRVAGAVRVGPTPGSGEWYSSPVDGLQAEQYDDSFCFYFADSHFQYQNNGLTVDPWNGYQPVPYNPPTDHTWTLVPGGGEGGETRIILTEGSFLGVWDASNVYDIVVLTETELVVRTPFLAGGGWFELYFVAR